MSSPSGRHQSMQRDVAAIICTCRSFQDCPFQDFLLDENIFTFTYVDPIGKIPPRQGSFNFSDDYPEQTVMTWTNEPNNLAIADIRVQFLFNQIAQDLSVDVQVPLTNCTMDAANLLDGTQPDSTQSTSENSSYYSDYNSDVNSDEYDNDDYYKEFTWDDENMMHPLLQQEIELVHAQYGDQSISHRLFGAIDDIDVELHIGISFLDAEIAKAWKMIREEPIVVRIHLSLSRYLDATEPKVEVFQPSQKEKFGIGSQLRKILEQFISNTWKDINNDLVEAKLAKPTRPRKVGASINKKRFPLQVSNAELGGQAAEGGASPAGDDVAAVIKEMGFTDEMARNALIISHGNLDEALNLLLTSLDGLACSSLLEDLDHHPEAKSRMADKDDVPTAPPQPHQRQPSHPMLPFFQLPTRDKRLSKSQRERLRVKGQVMGSHSCVGLDAALRRPAGSNSVMDAAACSSTLEDLNLLPSSTQSGKNAKQVPSLDNGFLLQVMQYTRQRLPTLNEYCVVCDEPHVFQNGAMLKPAVCARELCVFGFQTLGVMSDAAEAIATGAEVVNLLIAMAIAACRSNRRGIIFEPYPTVVDPNQTELALNPKKKDYKRCEKAMDGFMEMNEMMSLVGSDLKKKMDTIDPLSYPLLQWIITSNRSHIVKLPPEKQISFMHTPHQFLLMSSPPAKENVFRTFRQQYGSTFAFHGSHIENWHSIMRLGLLNATGTKHQVNGSAYGNGVYLSPHASVSFGYSRMGYGHYNPQKGHKLDGKEASRFLNSKNLTCIALCEVITHELKKHDKIWVQPKAEFCCTRFFFVYEDGQVGDSDIDTQVEKYQREVMHAVGYVTR